MENIMRLFLTVELALILLLGSISHAVEIVIKTPGEEKKEEEKKEEEEVELPERGQLDLNAINTTDYSVVITVRADGKTPNIGIIAQNIVPGNTAMTIGTLYTAEPKETFQFTQAEVFVMSKEKEHFQAITCNIKYPEPEEEKKEEKPEPTEAVLTIPMSLGDLNKPEAKDEEKTENSMDQAPGSEKKPEPLNEAKKSLDFYIYMAKGQAFPACLIHLK
jgi:hypothetical protein